MPEPLLPVAIVAHAQGRRGQALARACSRLVAEDPTLRLERNPETHQLVLWCMGEAHADVLLDRLREPVRRRRWTRAAAGVAARDVRRAGARGTAGTSSSPAATGSTPSATSRSSRCPQGAGFEFVDKVVGGAVPRQFIPSVEKGVRAQMERGVAAGYPVVDIRVTLVDGKAHRVDSSDMAFQTAGALALQGGRAAGATVPLLEPVDEVDVLVADEYVGAVMSDLSGRRGRVARHRAGRRRAHAGPGRGARRSRSPGTPSTCARSRTAPGRSPRTYLRHDADAAAAGPEGPGRATGAAGLTGQPGGQASASSDAGVGEQLRAAPRVWRDDRHEVACRRPSAARRAGAGARRSRRRRPGPG